MTFLCSNSKLGEKSWWAGVKIEAIGSDKPSTLLYYISRSSGYQNIDEIYMIDIEIQISISERSSGWAINFDKPRIYDTSHKKYQSTALLHICLKLWLITVWVVGDLVLCG